MSPTAPPGSRPDDRPVRIALAAVSVAVLGYGLLVAQAPLSGLLAVLFAWLVYLVWRFVRSLERIAAALERRPPREQRDRGDED